MNFLTFSIEKVRTLEVEPTSYCNAKCPHCMRESRNGDYSFFKQVHLTESFFEFFFPKQVAANLRLVSFSGNLGEPAMNKDFLNILRWFRKQNPNVRLEVYSNGGVQSVDWWVELGNTIGNNGNVIFGIDGLEDTNHIYRIDVKWKAVMKNVKAYISTGADATWQFIPFKHNQHQLEQAEQLSKELGFKFFKLKVSHRHLIGQPQNINTAVEPADDPRFIHPGVPINVNLAETEKYLDSVNINCYALDQESLYVDAEGRVFPCCHTSSIPLLEDDYFPAPYDWIRSIKKDWNYEELSLFRNALPSILESNTFNTMIESWGKTMSQGRNPICAAICGKCEDKNSLKDDQLNCVVLTN